MEVRIERPLCNRHTGLPERASTRPGAGAGTPCHSVLMLKRGAGDVECDAIERCRERAGIAYSVTHEPTAIRTISET
jgi:hypothetical protein